MIPEENPPSGDATPPVKAAFLDKGETLAPVVMAEVIEEAESDQSAFAGRSDETPRDSQLTPPGNLSATGGAVGSLVLGVWSIAGALISAWSIVNCVLALLLGLWGLNSPRPRLAVCGILCGAVGAIVCMFRSSV